MESSRLTMIRIQMSATAIIKMPEAEFGRVKQHACHIVDRDNKGFITLERKKKPIKRDHFLSGTLCKEIISFENPQILT